MMDGWSRFSAVVRKSRFLAAAALVFAASVAQGQNLQFVTVPKEVIKARLADAPKKDDDRKEKVLQLFRAVGCSGDALREQKVSGQHLPNIICTLRGSSPEQIVVGAHYDYIHEGQGIVDNWSGASLLPSLYTSLSDVPRQHTYVFIAFSGEEQGLVGSHYYVNHLSKEEREQIRAMVNIDTLGLAPTEVWISHADKDLVKGLAVIANATHLPVSSMNVERVGSSDSESFREKKIPSLTIHSLTSETLPILHSSRDTLKEINEDDYYSSYRLINCYVVYLDQALASSGEKQPAKASTP